MTSAARWSAPSPAREPVTGIRYGWMSTCPAVGCDWFEVRSDEQYAEDPETSAQQVVAALFQDHMDAEHPEHASY